MLTRWVFFLLLVPFAISACSGAKSGDSGTFAALGVPAARAAPAEAPVADFDVPGRLLVIRDGDIHRWSQRGSLERLAGGARFQSPAFSPDGSRIAVSVVGDNHSDLVLLSSNGSRLRQLTDNWSKTSVQESAWARHPAWSLDGSAIAYVSDAYGSQMSLWLVVATGDARRQLRPAISWSGFDWPTWSPSAKEIMVTSYDGNNSQLLQVSVNTGAYKIVTKHEDGAFDAAVSPDGTRLAFAARVGERTDIWMMDGDGGNLRRLTDVGSARAPAWSPGGDMISFLAEQSRGFDLYVIRPDLSGGVPAALATAKRLTNGQNLEAPSGISWSR